MHNVLTSTSSLLCSADGATEGMDHDRIAPCGSNGPVILPLASTPINIPAPLFGGDREIVGKWVGSKTIKLFLIKASSDFCVVFNADNTACITGTVNCPGYHNVPFTQPITWSCLGNCRYFGTHESISIAFCLKGDIMTIKANPYDLGLVKNKILDMPIEIELKKM
ncbi:MAG TPA: hypothetical protein VJ857_02105 [Methanocorpusculum sp.]|nr:hypothetical protein [Methanocorpusculum sp.]HJJ50052.1 hypothetical protein [Methanocorpusculum sp.]HKL97443.1 hypothetical protein [Methanocorpusculum sp.]